MDKKRLKKIIIVICLLIAFYIVICTYAILWLRTSDPCDSLIKFLKTNEEIADVCGEFHHASLYITGVVTFDYVEHDYPTLDKNSGSSELCLKFNAENGTYLITAYITGEDGVWTVNEYDLIEQP